MSLSALTSAQSQIKQLSNGLSASKATWKANSKKLLDQRNEIMALAFVLEERVDAAPEIRVGAVALRDAETDLSLKI